MTAALAIFVKTPGFSPVKTRLAAKIGMEKAEEFYRYSIKCLEELALTSAHLTQGQIVPYWAIAEEENVNHPLWRKLTVHWTGEGSFGERLSQVYTHLLEHHQHVIIIGSDSPQLHPSTIIAAHHHLKRRRGYIIGPSDDGGYYLFGGYKTLPLTLWTSVPYSVAHTCTVFTEKLQKYGKIKFLESNFDIDFYEDLLKLISNRYLMTSNAQLNLIKWIQQFIT